LGSRVRVGEGNNVDMVAGVRVVSSVEVSSALKRAVKRVPACDNWLDWLKYFELFVRGQIAVSEALKVSKKLVLLRCFDIVDDIHQYA
jgi:hypothetical protein